MAASMLFEPPSNANCSTTTTSFPKFADLPSELQLLIWDAALPRPRLISLWLEPAEHRQPRGFRLVNPKHCNPDGLLGATRASRSVALTFFHLRMPQCYAATLLQSDDERYHRHDPLAHDDVSRDSRLGGGSRHGYHHPPSALPRRPRRPRCRPIYISPDTDILHIVPLMDPDDPEDVGEVRELHGLPRGIVQRGQRFIRFVAELRHLDQDGGVGPVRIAINDTTWSCVELALGGPRRSRPGGGAPNRKPSPQEDDFAEFMMHLREVYLIEVHDRRFEDAFVDPHFGRRSSRQMTGGRNESTADATDALEAPVYNRCVPLLPALSAPGCDMTSSSSSSLSTLTSWFPRDGPRSQAEMVRMLMFAGGGDAAFRVVGPDPRPGIVEKEVPSLDRGSTGLHRMVEMWRKFERHWRPADTPPTECFVLCASAVSSRGNATRTDVQEFLAKEEHSRARRLLASKWPWQGRGEIQEALEREKERQPVVGFWLLSEEQTRSLKAGDIHNSLPELALYDIP